MLNYAYAMLESQVRISNVAQSLDPTIGHLHGLAVSPELEGVTGCYFDGTREARANRQAYDAEARKGLWALSEELCGKAEG